MADASSAADSSDAVDTPPFAGGIDLTRNPLQGNPFAPDSNDPTLESGQVLYHLALGASPDDFQPALQPLAKAYGPLFQRQPGPTAAGLLGPVSADADASSTTSLSADGSVEGSDGDGADDPEIDDGDESTEAGQSNPSGDGGLSAQEIAAKLLQRDARYLDRYYDAANRYAKQYRVNPAFVLGLGSESGFGTEGTYNQTGDALGMTGGSTRHMTTAASPEENIRKFFNNYGSRVYGVGDDVDAFIDALQARDANGSPIPGLKKYNSEHPEAWEKMARGGIRQMQRDLPMYLPTRTSRPQVN